MPLLMFALACHNVFAANPEQSEHLFLHKSNVKRCLAGGRERERDPEGLFGFFWQIFADLFVGLHFTYLRFSLICVTSGRPAGNTYGTVYSGQERWEDPATFGVEHLILLGAHN